MKYIVWQEYTQWYGYEVEADSPEEAKEIYLSDGFNCAEHECGMSDGRWGQIEVEER